MSFDLSHFWVSQVGEKVTFLLERGVCYATNCGQHRLLYLGRLNRQLLDGFTLGQTCNSRIIYVQLVYGATIKRSLFLQRQKFDRLQTFHVSSATSAVIGYDEKCIAPCVHKPVDCAKRDKGCGDSKIQQQPIRRIK